MSGECDRCGEHALECACDQIEMNKMRIENMKHQLFYLKKFFPWTSTDPSEVEEENDEGLLNHRPVP